MAILSTNQSSKRTKRQAIQSKKQHIKWQLENLNVFFLSRKGKCSCATVKRVGTCPQSAWWRVGVDEALSTCGVGWAAHTGDGASRRGWTSLGWCENSGPSNFTISSVIFVLNLFVKVMHFAIMVDVATQINKSHKKILNKSQYSIRCLHNWVLLTVLLFQYSLNESHLKDVVHGSYVSEKSLELDEKITDDRSCDHSGVDVLQIFHVVKILVCLGQRDERPALSRCWKLAKVASRWCWQAYVGGSGRLS